MEAYVCVCVCISVSHEDRMVNQGGKVPERNTVSHKKTKQNKTKLDSYLPLYDKKE